MQSSVPWALLTINQFARVNRYMVMWRGLIGHRVVGPESALPQGLAAWGGRAGKWTELTPRHCQVGVRLWEATGHHSKGGVAQYGGIRTQPDLALGSPGL